MNAPPMTLWCVEIPRDEPATVRVWIGRLHHFDGQYQSPEIARHFAERIARGNKMRRTKFSTLWRVSPSRRPRRAS